MMRHRPFFTNFACFLLLMLCNINNLHSQIFADPSFFPGWNNRNNSRVGLKDLAAMRIGVGATHWDYRDKPLKWSGNIDFNLFQKASIGMGLLGENDYYVSVGSNIFATEGLEVDLGIQRYQFSSFKGFSNNLYLNAKFEIKYPFYGMIESSYAWNTNYSLMKSPFTVSARVGLFFDLTATGFGGFGGFEF